MTPPGTPKASILFQGIVVLLFLQVFRLPVAAQTDAIVDSFDPAGIGQYNYANSQIIQVWTNWFGGAFESVAWDPLNDASSNAASGSMKITANFSVSDSQWAVYDFNGTFPPVNGIQYTQFEFDVRFAPGSSTTTNGGVPLFGRMLFGVANGWSQDWFGAMDIPISATNWMHVSVPINAAGDTNLANIYNVILHIYGPYYTPMTGISTCWVDNIKFSGPTPVTTNCIVNWNEVHQRIDGFGASSGFRSGLTTNRSDIFTTNMADMFFSTNTGIGLSLLKSVIVAGTTVETNIMQMAQARGAKVWCTPYTPDAAFKNNDNINGGSFLSASNQAYADELAGFVASMKNNYGVNLYAISIQNEPDIAANYQSCLWTPQQIHDFVPYLQSALVANNVASTKIMLAEDDNWQTNYYLTAMSDPAVATNVGIIAAHDYDGSPPSVITTALPKFANTNAALWESEVSTFDPFDGSIGNAMYWANRIHLFMTVAQVNAFNYWWLIVDNNNNDNEGLTDLNANPAKRMYALGNYSRFIRPGYYRMGVANNAFTSISAYKDPSSGNFAIVAINPSVNTVTQVFNLAYFTASSVTPWITSGTLSLSNQSPVLLTNSSFTYALPSMSVVTFAGQASVGSPVATTCSLSSSTNNVPFASPIVLSSTVSPAPPNFESVVFLDGTTVLGSGTLNGGVAMLTTAALGVGTHNLTAFYNGDVSLNASTSSVATVTVTYNPTITARLSIKFAADQSYNSLAINQNWTTPATKQGAGALNTTNWYNMSGTTVSNINFGTYDLNGSTNGNLSTATLIWLAQHNEWTCAYNDNGAGQFTNNNVSLLDSANYLSHSGNAGIDLVVTNLDPAFATNGYRVYLYYMGQGASPYGNGQRFWITNFVGQTTNTTVAGSQGCSLFINTNYNAFGHLGYETNCPANLLGTAMFIQGAQSTSTSLTGGWQNWGANFIVFSNCPAGGAFGLYSDHESYGGLCAMEIVANPVFMVIGPVVTPSTNVYAGTTANLSCTPSGGAAPFSLQWQGCADDSTWTNVTGAMAASLVLPNFAAGNAGFYQLVYTAGSRSATSSVVHLAFIATLPSIGAATAAPGNVVDQGTTVTLNCTTNGGAPPFSLQWQACADGVNYTNLAGATGLPLTLGGVTPANSSYYQLVFTANSLSVTSSAVQLSVNPAPTINVHPSGGNTVLSWSSGILLQSTNLTGPWTTNNAPSPYTNPTTSPRMFYRVLSP